MPQTAVHPDVHRGLSTEEIARLLKIEPKTITHIIRSLGVIVDFATANGVTGSTLAELTGNEIRRVIEEPVSAAYATPEEGLAMLLNEEGGCVDVEEATALYRKHKPVTTAAITDRIRNGDMIAYRTGGGQYRIPRWQFKVEGGLLDGLSNVLHALRQSDTAFNQLTPFTFFLQPHPLTGTRTPLEALRAKDIESVVGAAMSEADE